MIGSTDSPPAVGGESSSLRYDTIHNKEFGKKAIIMEHVIQVENLTHCYGNQVCYQGLNFKVPAGKIFGLLGKNGVGKTTLIKILMGFLRPTAGRCKVFGEDSHNLSPAARARIGLLFEGHLAYEFMTIAQIERFYALHYSNWSRDDYYGLVDRLGLPHTHLIKNMSCGQRSQVVLGLIMAQQPELLLLDDYSMGLDAGYRRLFLDYMREYLDMNGMLMVYIAIDTRHLFVMDHAEMVWYRVLHLGRIHYYHLKYAPAATGALLACIQYLPEMTGERLRLTLHLPVSPHRLIIAHIVVGLAAVKLVIALDLISLTLITARFFPAEAVSTTLMTALPWAVAGVAAYLGVTLALLEPSYHLKLSNLAIAAGVVGLFIYPADPGSYKYILLHLLLPILLMIPAALLPAYRFRYRRVSA
jgi:ABC-type Mn2+/Zn2+ transport system ATPase subunit